MYSEFNKIIRDTQVFFWNEPDLEEQFQELLSDPMVCGDLHDSVCDFEVPVVQLPDWELCDHLPVSDADHRAVPIQEADQRAVGLARREAIRRKWYMMY